MTTDYKPRLYQLNARDQIIHCIEQEGKRVLLVLLPTGMGKTLISSLTIEMLIDRGIIKNDEKVLFLVQDRKLKHQLYEMAKEYGLSNQGYLFLLDDQKGIPAHMAAKHASMAKVLFATPVKLMNAVTARRPLIDDDTLKQVKVVVIDEILDVFAQSYGKQRPRSETEFYIEKKYGNGRTFREIIADLKYELEVTQKVQIDEEKLIEQVLREFSSKSYRLDKRFQPILNYLSLLDPSSERIIIGLTAALSQDMKIDLLKKTFGGEEYVEEIRPVGDDFEDYRPAYQLRRIRVFDDWVTNVDMLVSTIKKFLLSAINQSYKIITGREKIPPDRILLFISDLLAKTEMKEKLLKGVGGDTQKRDSLLASASAYLFMTVTRQRLLESTFPSFVAFIEKINNRVLTANTEFQDIKEAIASRIEKELPDEKEKRLLFWLKRLKAEGKNVLVLCRFVDMTKHLMHLAEKEGIPSANVHGKMSGSLQYGAIKKFKSGTAKVLFASERLIEKGTDLPEADVGIYYGTTVSLERYEQSLGRIRSSVRNIKTFYTISYNQTVEDEKSLKRETLFLELVAKQSGKVIPEDED